MEEFNLDEMRHRLDTEIKRQRRSQTEVSLASGLSKGYLNGVISREQVPTVDKMHEVCKALGKPMSWALYGVDSPQIPDAALELLESNPAKFYALLELLK